MWYPSFYSSHYIHIIYIQYSGLNILKLNHSNIPLIPKTFYPPVLQNQGCGVGVEIFIMLEWESEFATQVESESIFQKREVEMSHKFFVLFYS